MDRVGINIKSQQKTTQAAAHTCCDMTKVLSVLFVF
uniref:Uncharacterized protein n=1 Tax=Anguilla anguilla TaxID=7936 RepID=A0A0E9XTS0_ANGAN